MEWPTFRREHGLRPSAAESKPTLLHTCNRLRNKLPLLWPKSLRPSGAKARPTVHYRRHGLEAVPFQNSFAVEFCRKAASHASRTDTLLNCQRAFALSRSTRIPLPSIFGTRSYSVRARENSLPDR